MPAPEGNQFWKARSSHGRKPTFADPEQLQEACLEYIDWVEANPLYSAELTTYQGASKLENVPKMRAMTISGLCIFLDIDQTTWREYAKKKDFSSVTTRVEEIIRTQKFEGASAGFLNPNIIARDLGLAEKIDAEHSGKGGGPIATTQIDAKKLSKKQLEALATINIPTDSR